MSDIAYVFLKGRVTRDPELRHLSTGTPKLEFGVAINTVFKKNDQKHEKTTFLDVEVWKTQAEVLSKLNFKKGTSVVIIGSLDTNTWEKDGKKYSKLIVSAREVILDSKKSTKEDVLVEETSGGDDLPF